jgi:8-oxo-dGTP pyrophosphatase MutT (NUDIX family)
MQGNPWKRHGRTFIYENAWITVNHDEVTRPDGKPGIYGVVHFKHRAVGVVAIDEEDRILLVGQYRYPLDVYSWELPEGGAHQGENLAGAAARELREETGVTAERWTRIVRAHLSNSVTDEEATIFLAEGFSHGDAEPEGDELLQVKWVPFADAVRMVFEGEITDAISVMGILRVAAERRPGGDAERRPSGDAERR